MVQRELALLQAARADPETRGQGGGQVEARVLPYRR